MTTHLEDDDVSQGRRTPLVQPRDALYLRDGVPNDNDLLTPGEVSALLHVHSKTLSRWASEGKIASLRLPGGHRRYRRGDLPLMSDAKD